MKNYFKQWNFIRVIRLAMGVYILVQGFVDRQWFFVGFGLIFTMMPIFNIACCRASGCSANVRETQSENKEVEYEEVR